MEIKSKRVLKIEAKKQPDAATALTAIFEDRMQKDACKQEEKRRDQIRELCALFQAAWLANTSLRMVQLIDNVSNTNDPGSVSDKDISASLLKYWKKFYVVD